MDDFKEAREKINKALEAFRSIQHEKSNVYVTIITDAPATLPSVPNLEQPKDPRLGPHAGKEAELLLKGTKPVAMVSKYCKELNLLYETAQRGQLVAGGIDHKECHYFCQLGKEEDMEELINIYQNIENGTLKFSDSLHARIGKILGYTDLEINAFLEKGREFKAKQMPKACSQRAYLILNF